MSNVLDQFGVAVGELTAHSPTNYPDPVDGRVVHIDADFLAYQVSAESNEELDPTDSTPRKSLEDMKHNARTAVNYLMKLAGATDYVCHVTPTGSTKGGRDAQAIQQEYQATRKARDNKPEHLDTIRAFITKELNGCAHMDQEADDGMAQAAYNATDPNLVVIASKDKDLCMVPGLHLMQDTGRIINVENKFGYIEIDDSKSSKKLVGFGTKFFWAQLLMGDPADNIKGVPEVPGEVYLQHKPTTAFNKDLETFKILLRKENKTESEIKRFSTVSDRLIAAKKKTKSCGPMMAFTLLDRCDSDVECFYLIKYIFNVVGKFGYKFVHWRTGEEVTPTQAMLADMQLLWMRRNKNPNDVLDWLKERLNE